jgi:signal transduction histidine kinase
MSQYADSDDLALGSTYHVLLRETEALEKTIGTMLSIEPHASGTSSTDFRGTSFYRELELRYRNGKLNMSATFSTLRVVLKEVDRYRAILGNLVGFVSRDQPLRPNRVPVDLATLLEEATDLFEASAFAKGISLQLEAPRAALIHGDPQLLYRVLINLLDNAIKYSFSTTAHSSQRHVDILCRRHSTDGQYLISVTSYGVGVTLEEIESGAIFEYGVRGKLASDREREGTGIGLAECKRIVDAHGGSIKLKSDPRSGAYVTTVNVVLPSGREVI